jgi:uncharacterized protein
MTTTPNIDIEAANVSVAIEEAPTGHAAGDPAILGLPIFAAGSIALGLALVGYVPAVAVTSVLPIMLAATGLGLLISTVWAASLGQTVVAGIFGLFTGFWLSYAALLLGLNHNWFLIPTEAVERSVALFLITWAVVMFALTVGTLRLPLAYTLVLGLVASRSSCSSSARPRRARRSTRWRAMSCWRSARSASTCSSARRRSRWAAPATRWGRRCSAATTDP